MAEAVIDPLSLEIAHQKPLPGISSGWLFCAAACVHKPACFNTRETVPNTFHLKRFCLKDFIRHISTTQRMDGLSTCYLNPPGSFQYPSHRVLRPV